MFKYLFKRDTILATISVFVLVALLSLIPINADVLDPIKLALQDFDFNDMAYSQFNKNEQTGVDTNIVIVNISDVARPEIAAIIEAVVIQAPAVVGVDVLFNEPRDSLADAHLRQLYSRKNVVLAYDLVAHKGSSLKPTGFLFSHVAHKGYANFVGEEAGVIRHFAPSFQQQGTTYLSFPAAIAGVAFPQQFQTLMSKKKIVLPVNYSRTKDKFIVVEGSALLQPSEKATLLANKVVLIGFVAENENNIEDKHFTPFNKKSVGRSVPDMEGIFIHANIIGMIRDGNYVMQAPVWINWSLASILCWLHMAVFIRYDKYPLFHLAAKIGQVISAALFVYLGLLFYYKWNIKIDLIPTFIAIILAVDVLYFYESFMAWLHKKTGIHSLFVNKH